MYKYLKIFLFTAAVIFSASCIKKELPRQDIVWYDFEVAISFYGNASPIAGLNIVSVQYVDVDGALTENDLIPVEYTDEALSKGVVKIPKNSQVTITLKPVDVSDKTSITGDIEDGYEKSDTKYIFVMDGNKKFNISFVGITYTLNLNIGLNGKVKINNVLYSGIQALIYPKNTTLTLVAVGNEPVDPTNPAESYYKPATWTGDLTGPGETQKTLKIDNNKNVGVTFTQIHTLTINVSQGGKATVDGITYSAGSHVIKDFAPKKIYLSAPEDNDQIYYFYSWSGSLKSNNLNENLNATGNTVVNANFIKMIPGDYEGVFVTFTIPNSFSLQLTYGEQFKKFYLAGTYKLVVPKNKVFIILVNSTTHLIAQISTSYRNTSGQVIQNVRDVGATSINYQTSMNDKDEYNCTIVIGNAVP